MLDYTFLVQLELRCSYEALVLLVKVKQVPAESLQWLSNDSSFGEPSGAQERPGYCNHHSNLGSDHRHYTRETEGTTVKAKYFKGRRVISNILSYATLPSSFDSKHTQ